MGIDKLIENWKKSRFKTGRLEFWECIIKNNRVIKKDNLFTYRLMAFSNKYIWKRVLAWKNSIYRLGYIECFGNKAYLPILVIHKKAKDFGDPKCEGEGISKPKVVIDKKGVVWRLNKDLFIIRNDIGYYNKQIEFYREECKSRILKSKKAIATCEEFIEEEKQKKKPDTAFLKAKKEQKSIYQKDIEFYSQEFNQLTKK